ncbi:M20 family metallopeptidase [Sporolactobacillus putidus]|uniref:Acetylornithine deacetylase n=1 Tax=Sporolactobacillus putidus TaxID=492735 RepID=A0A917S5R7_9BACL|nr:ArgE/DapE family deacylase [Sporolactobacillus putidus]GGL56982.1 acetylornithine deacetylase [Sporolactobacillus putidus]
MAELNVRKSILEQKEKFIDFLSLMIKTDTQVKGQGILGGNERFGQKIVKQKLLDLNFDVDEFDVEDDKIKKFPGANLGHQNENRPNVVGVLKGSGGGRSLILNGHIDTMPYGDPSQWTKDPFLGEVLGGEMFGLGATDMKASLSAMILAAEVIHNLGVRLKGDLIIQSVVDEEGGGNGTMACVERGYRADGAIVGEPTQLHLQTAHMGFLFHEIKVSGKSLHSSQLWEGINAIDKALKIYHELKELERQWLMTRRHPLLPGPTINLGVIEGGVAGSVVPNSCTMRFCLHYHPEKNEAKEVTRDRVENEVAEVVHLVSQSDPWLKINPPQISIYQEGFPFETSLDHPLVQKMKQTLNNVLDEAVIEGMPAGCDARTLSEFGQTPTIILGCGNPQHCHCVNETVPVSQFISLIEIYTNFILSWCGTEQNGRPV